MYVLTSAAVGSTVIFGIALSAGTSIGQTLRGWNWTLAVSGIGSIGGPTILLLLGRQYFNSLMAVATQTSIPVVVIVATGVLDTGSELQEQIPPALVALAGALLVLPVALPESARGWIGFGLYLASASLAGISSVISHREMTRVSHGTAFFTVAAANTFFFGVTSLLWPFLTTQRPFFAELISGATLLDTGAALLSFVVIIPLLCLLTPQALASRFVFTPLFAAIEAYALMRPSLSVRTAVGASFMLAGALACLRSDSKSASSTSMSLR